ncbi:MAG: hypothetical protein ACFCU8_17715 [Thermosynechococcaceae cyanobacterium]
MTQAIDTDLRTLIEKLDHKIDQISTDVVEVKVSLSAVNERFNTLDAKTDERFNTLNAKTDERFIAINQRFDNVDQRFDNVDQRLGSLESSLKAQDNRIWSLIVAVFLALFSLLAKMSFFPPS